MITIGTDIIDVARIRTSEPALARRVLLPSERDYCAVQADPPLHMAGRFAAKEAVFKALNAPAPNRISWHDIEVINDKRGAPVVYLHGAAAVLAAERRLRGTCLSIAHVRDFAIATAVCEWPDDHA